MAEINKAKATESPEDLVLSSPSIPGNSRRYLSRVFPGQSWSTIMASNFIMLHESNMRDNDVVADVIGRSMSPFIDNVNADELKSLSEESDERREDIGLESIDENIYVSQRDPNLIRDFAYDLIREMGLEASLGEDVIDGPDDTRIVVISDDGVEDEVDSGIPPSIKSRAEEIATKLGLIHIPDEVTDSLIIPDIFKVDSTDPYTKKVIR